MKYLQIPTEVSSHDIRAKEFSWSPGMYRRVEIPNSNTKTVRELLDPHRPYDTGTEPGSLFYMARSKWKFIRTKALQEHSTLLYPKGEAIIALNPKGVKNWAQFDLQDGDLLMTKDSNVGECIMVDGDGWENHAWSNGIVRLHPRENRFYFFAFVKHPLFKAQLLSMLPKGVTIIHARDLWLDCTIPFPTQNDAARVIAYVSALMQAVMDKEKAIRARNQQIDAAIGVELETSVSQPFNYQFPNIHEIRALGRLDASMYCEDFKRKIHFITNYSGGVGSYEDLGFEIGRGQNLQVSCIGLSHYSDYTKPNWYRLMAPTDISEYRTVTAFRYLGSARNLNELKQGDVIFGAEGFCKGRVIILADEVQKTISNIHGVIFHPIDGNMTRGIFLGCYLGYLRSLGLIDAIGAGGSGGSLAIGYMHHVPIPKFPDAIQAQIARLYHNPTPAPATAPTLDSFVEWHRAWNEGLGIWELDREMKVLQTTLREVQDEIIRGQTVTVPFE